MEEKVSNVIPSVKFWKFWKIKAFLIQTNEKGELVNLCESVEALNLPLIDKNDNYLKTDSQRQNVPESTEQYPAELDGKFLNYARRVAAYTQVRECVHIIFH